MEYKPFVIMKLDREREFSLSNRAFFTFEEMTGTKIQELDFDNLGIVAFNHLVFSGLKARDASITLDDTIDLIDEFGDIDAINKTIVKAVESSRFLSRQTQKQPKNTKK